MSSGHLKTLLVDDELIARLVLREELREAPDVEIVGEAENGEQGTGATTYSKIGSGRSLPRSADAWYRWIRSGPEAAVGISQRLWHDAARVVNYSHSYRAPALEELYNHGPHPGNLAFEVGNPDLSAERNDGLDISLRRQSSRIHGELSVFYYHVADFAPTGNIEDGLREAEYLQENSRFIGGEARVDVGPHPNFWIDLAADTVNARLTGSETFLPRIPPLRGRIGFDGRYKGLSIRPEFVMAYAQNKVFPTETPTAGYAVVSLGGSYTIARQHDVQVFSVNMFNAGDRLYRNHLSFIKEFAPEIGRGVRLGYTVQFF